MTRLTICVVFTFVLMSQHTDAEDGGGMINASQSEPSGERNPKDLPIVAYADRLSVQPGETIQFMVSSKHERYQAEILRLIHSDPNPLGPGIKEELIDSDVSGEYPGKFQPLPNGSYASIQDRSNVENGNSVSLRAGLGATTPLKGVQSIISKQPAPGNSGYGLYLDENGALAVVIGNGSANKYTTGVSLHDSYPRTERPRNSITTLPPRSTMWYFVAATFDASNGEVTLYQLPLEKWPHDESRAVVSANSDLRSIERNELPLLIAATWDEYEKPTAFFNGKIDNPKVYSSALSKEEIEAFYRGDVPDGAVAAWDFSANVSSTGISDISGNRLHGTTVNLPTRAVTGYNWKGDEVDFRRVPEQYAAIHFHDDDLDDANWEVAFDYVVPDNLPSGVYAARLTAGDSMEYVPFFVRPLRGTATAPAALLIPTFSYLAYANGFDDTTPELLSAYDHHTDGSGVAYSSRLRPILDMRPNVNPAKPWEPWQFVADMHLVDWLTVKEFPFDVITEHDLHFDGLDLLERYKVVLTGTHPEYYSTQMLDSVQGYLEAGGRLMYLGANGFYWVTTLDSSGNSIEIRRWAGTRYWEAMPGEYHHSTTGEIGGLWRNRGRAPQKLVGVGFTAQGFDRNAPYRRAPDSFDSRAAFIFEGIGDDELIGNFPSLVQKFGAAGSELDRLDFALGTPAHALLLATASGEFSDEYQHVIEEVQTSNEGPWDELVKADMVYFEYPNGGAVWTPASIAWCGSLSFDDYNNNVSRITENVLREFLTR